MADSESEGLRGGSEARGKSDPSAWIFLVLMVLITSTTATSAKFAVHELPIALLPLIRFGVAGLCLLAVVGWRAPIRLLRADSGRLLVAASLCVPINQTFFLNGARLVPTAHVGLIYAACPLIVLALASILGQERPDLRRIVGVLLSVVGVAVIALDNLRQGGSAGRLLLLGDLLTVGAVTSWGAYLTVSKPLITRHGPLPTLAATFLVGAALDVPLALATLTGSPPLSDASPAAWCGLAFLTLVVTVFGLACQNQALRRLDASQVATVGNASPILTVIWGIWLFHEAITPALILGGALTLGSILWTSRPRWSLAPSAPTSAPRVVSIAVHD